MSNHLTWSSQHKLGGRRCRKIPYMGNWDFRSPNWQCGQAHSRCWDRFFSSFSMILSHVEAKVMASELPASLIEISHLKPKDKGLGWQELWVLCSIFSPFWEGFCRWKSLFKLNQDRFIYLLLVHRIINGIKFGDASNRFIVIHLLMRPHSIIWPLK